jgi:hypothetical protein
MRLQVNMINGVLVLRGVLISSLRNFELLCGPAVIRTLRRINGRATEERIYEATIDVKNFFKHTVA